MAILKPWEMSNLNVDVSEPTYVTTVLNLGIRLANRKSEAVKLHSNLELQLTIASLRLPSLRPPKFSSPPLLINFKPATGNMNKDDDSQGETMPEKPEEQLYRGKWTDEEESYAHYLIEEFRLGNLSIPHGTTLRGYLARKLDCAPKR